MDRTLSPYGSNHKGQSGDKKTLSGEKASIKSQHVQGEKTHQLQNWYNKNQALEAPKTISELQKFNAQTRLQNLNKGK